MTDRTDLERRHLLRTAAASAAVLGTANTASAQASQPGTQKAAVPGLRAFESQSDPKPLSFDPARVKGLSERMLRSHWENNYGGSVRALAVVKKSLEQALASKDTPPYIYNELKREHLLRTGSVVLHEYYFDNLGGSGQAGASARSVIGDAFGSFDTWETEFRRIGAGLGGGSGWVVLGYNTQTRQLENYWLADHAHSPAATMPLLVMDMYEHSYQMDYGAAAAKYIDAFFANIQWDAVSSRIEATQRMRQT
jgi:superoxide dismutase, Fe-Mn family